MVIRDVCPRCPAPKLKTNGHMPNGQPHPHCQAGGRPCVQGGEPDRLSNDTRGLRERFLVARLSFRGIGRAVGVTRKGLLGVLGPGCEAVPEPLHVPPVSWPRAVVIPRREVEAEARVRLVQKQAQKQGGSAMETPYTSS
jgi:transposase-like protein